DPSPRDRPAISARAVAPDPRAVPHRLRRGARRPAHVQDRAHPERGPDAADVRATRPRGDDVSAARGVGHHRGPAVGQRAAALRAQRGEPCAGGHLAPDTDGRDRAGRIARVAGDGLGDDRGPPLDPVVGRRRRGAWPGVVARRRGGDASARAGALHGRRRRDLTMPRAPFLAVNLISDPIHGYVELTKRLTAAESTAAGLPAEDVAEEDLLDSAWLQRLRRISQLQSARWVFPTAEHSRFTHGLGVMHEAGLWARALYPSLRSTLAGLGETAPSEGLVVETMRMAGLLHDVGHGPFAHFFDDHVLAAF